MFEGEGDKKKRVYPRLPNMLGKKDTPLCIVTPYYAMKSTACRMIMENF